MKKALLSLLLTMFLVPTMTACGQNSSNPLSPVEENPLAEAESAFEYAVSNFTEAQSDLQNNILSAEVLLETVSDSDVTDPTSLSDLRNLLDKAQESVDAVVPTKGSEVEKIQNQAQNLTEQANDIWDLSYEISNASFAIQSSQQELANAKRMEGLEAQEALVATVETSTGYRVEYTVCLTPWIKGSENDSLQLAWEGVGGSGDVPSSLYDNRAAIAFGTISFKNITEGFDISEDYPLSPGIHVSVNKNVLYEVLTYPTLYIEYSDRSQTFQLGAGGRSNITPYMTRNTWGPNHFMVVCSDAYIPNAPDGIAALDDFSLEFNYKEYAKVPTD